MKPPAQTTVADSNSEAADPLAAELAIQPSVREQRPQDWFEDVSESSGVDFRYDSGRKSLQYSMIESFGGGVALFDFDQDGDLDLLSVGGGNISADLVITGQGVELFRNDGDLKFHRITNEVGLDVEFDYGHGVAVGDINNDQFPDVFVTCYGQSRLFQNKEGTHFEDVTERLSPIPTGWQTAACFADFNNDSHTDLYVAGYLKWEPNQAEFCLDPTSKLRDICMPGDFPDARDHLYLNTGEGTFIDQSEAWGLRDDGKGLGVIAGDLSGDGDIDLYVANDVDRNFFYENQAHESFEEQGILAGNSGNEFGIPEGSMGIDGGDLNRDGLIDILVTNYELEENAIYMNLGEGVFSHGTVTWGFAGRCRPYVGFGTKIADFDCDGWNDIIIVNGHVTYRNRKSSYLQPALLYNNKNGERLEFVESPSPWFDIPHAGRGLAVGDLDNNGTLDVVVTAQDETVSILKNRHQCDSWVGFNLIGKASGTDAVGTSVTLLTEDSNIEGEEWMQSILKGGGYLSYSDHRILFPLPEMTLPVKFQIRWSSGTNQTVTLNKKNRYVTIIESAKIESQE